MTFYVENITNACIVLSGKRSGEKILIDPWFTDGIYMGTWHNFPRVSADFLTRLMLDVDVVLYTHLHKDHFDIETANKYFKKEVLFVLPKVFGWQVMASELKKNNFQNIKILECNHDELETKEFVIRAVPPLNISGLEAQADNNLSIDGGFALIHKVTSAKCVFLADDNLYSTERVLENLEVIKNPDLIGVAYSGFASDYPFNYNYSEQEIIEICQSNELQRFNIQVENLKLISPRFLLPYSSEFVAVGKHAEVWRKTLAHVWTGNKQIVADRYSTELGCQAAALYPGDRLLVDDTCQVKQEEIFPENAKYFSYDRMLEYANKIGDQKYEVKFLDCTAKISELPDLLMSASENFKKAISKHKLSPTQDLEFSADGIFLGLIKKNGQFFKKRPSGEKSDNTLKVDCEIALMHALLIGKEHWDDACLSMRLTWERKPDVFCSDTMNALYYLHL